MIVGSNPIVPASLRKAARSRRAAFPISPKITPNLPYFPPFFTRFYTVWGFYEGLPIPPKRLLRPLPHPQDPRHLHAPLHLPPGLYCRFQKPVFFRKDKEIQNHLGLNQKALQRARMTLQERGLITFISGKGNQTTTYHMLGTVLLPEGMAKSTIPCGQNKGKGMDILSTPIIKNKDRLKNRIGDRRQFGTTAQELLKKYKEDL